MLFAINFDYKGILEFSMIVIADSLDDAKDLLNNLLASDEVFLFTPTSLIRVVAVRTKNIKDNFKITDTLESGTFKWKDIKSTYSIINKGSIEEEIIILTEDDIPTKPDNPAYVGNKKPAKKK